MKQTRRHLLRSSFAIAFLGLSAMVAWGRGGPPPELGQVAWERDLKAALATSRASGRPVFLLFQEVPGCQTCVSFGEQVLGHPLLVEAIETEFVPVLVYNNRGGSDRELLERFGEPAWNNPVVRLLGGDARDLLPRKAGVFTPYGVAARMTDALRVSERPVPDYLRAAADELRPRPTHYATFGMSCFWSGEACLGEIPGIVASRAGFLGGREVVEVTFDPAEISYAELVAAARRDSCADEVFAQTDDQERKARAVFGRRVQRTRDIARSAPAKDQKRSLRGTRFAGLELTEHQAVQVNAAVAAGRSPTPYLSPRQRMRLDLAGETS